MTSKFLERFKASIDQKISLGSVNIPINKSLNPSQIHYFESNKSKSSQVNPPLVSLPKIKSIKKIKVFKKNLIILSENEPFKNQKLPEINYSKPNSKISLRSHKINSKVNKSYAGSPVNFRDVIKKDFVYEKKSFLPSPENVKSNKYQILGGLGPNIGDEKWTKAHLKKEKMIQYWKVIKKQNCSIG